MTEWDLSLGCKDGSTETNPHTYSKLIFDEGAKNMHHGKTVSSINCAEKTGYPYAEE